MSKIVEHIPRPLTDEEVESLKRLADMPDSEINTEDIPETNFTKPHTVGRYYAQAMETLQRKAS